MGHIDPTREVFAQFKANDRAGPIHMLNLVRLRAMAALSGWPRGDRRRGLCGLRPREAGRCSNGSGGKIVWQGRFELMLIGPETERWDHCFIAEYPSVGAFAEMIRDPVYREAVKHRQAAVEDSRLIRHAQWYRSERRSADSAIKQIGAHFTSPTRSRIYPTSTHIGLTNPGKTRVGWREELAAVAFAFAVQSNLQTSRPDRRPRESGRTIPSARRWNFIICICLLTR